MSKGKKLEPDFHVDQLLGDSDEDDDEEFIQQILKKNVTAAAKPAAPKIAAETLMPTPVSKLQQQVAAKNMHTTPKIEQKPQDTKQRTEFISAQVNPVAANINKMPINIQSLLAHHSSDEDQEEEKLQLRGKAQPHQAQPSSRVMEELGKKHGINFDDDSDDNDEDIMQLVKGSKRKNQMEQNNSTNTNTKNQHVSPDFQNSQQNVGNGVDKLLEEPAEPSSLDILEVIEKNEKLNEVGGREKIIDQGAQLLSFDKKFYTFKKKLFDYNEYTEITNKLFLKKDHQFKGVISALTIVQDYLFIGNSQGIIRVFDIKSQKEMKPLMDSSLGDGNKVTSLDISQDGGFMMSGYKGGQIALWDLVGYKLIKVVSDLHKTEVINAKIYFMDEQESLFVLSAEDAGAVQFIKFYKKNFMGGYASEAQFLFKQRLKGTSSIAIQRKNELYPHKFCDSTSLVAFGSLNEIVVCQMRPKIKEIFNVQKPSFCKEKSIPYIDWGYGLTPSQRDKTVPIVAFAWDRLIQLCYINERTNTIEFDGFYYSDHEINSLYFIGDSILFVLVNQCEVKVLYTTKFYPGHFEFLEQIKPGDLLGRQFQSVIEVTQHSELEKGFDIAEIKTSVLQVQQVVNFTQSVKRYKNQIFFLGTKQIVRGKVFTWREFIDYIKFKENADWSTVLKTALEIYNGEAKGFARVPDEKEVREGLLGGYMKDMIKESVQQAITKFNGSSTRQIAVSREEQKNMAQSALQWDLIAIKSAIEFCLAINSTQLLFTDIFQLFAQSGLETKFLANLEPFILSGSFKKIVMPEFIVNKLITHYQEALDYRKLEKVIMQLDLTEYSMKEELIVTCQQHCLIGANLYLMSQHEEDQLRCMQILNTLLSIIRKSQNLSEDKEDVLMVNKVDMQRKYEIEKSKIYVGYKLFYIMKIFLDGKAFPIGYLAQEKYRHHVYDIVDVLSQDQLLEEMLTFDSEVFFRVILKVFTGQPLKFLSTQKDYFLKNGIKWRDLCKAPEVIINELLQRKVELNPKDRRGYYNRFVIQVQSMQAIEQNARINVTTKILVDAFLDILQNASAKDPKGYGQIDEQDMINAFKSKKFNKEEVQKFPGDISLREAKMVNFRVLLLETRGDFINSYKVNKLDINLKKNIFKWIDITLGKLSQDPKSQDIVANLKNELIKDFKDLREIDIGGCQAMIDSWFDEQLQEKLIMGDLASYPEEQYKYLKKWVLQNESKISKLIEESLLDQEKAVFAQRYMQYLKTLIRLMCKFDKSLVHEYVKKDFYPISECLDICNQEQADLAVAILHKRNGDYMHSLNTYLGIIELQCEPLEMVKELSNFQNLNERDPNVQDQIKKYIYPYPIPANFQNLSQFDGLLEECISLSTKYIMVMGENSWFRILEFLQDYADRVIQRIMQSMTKEKAKAMSPEEKFQINRLHYFVSYRKTMVLKNLPGNISLQRLCDRLELDFHQINTIYENKVHDYKENLKYLRVAKKLQEKELALDLKDFFKLDKRGPKLLTKQVCSSCQKPLQTQNSKTQLQILMFVCGHSYHQNCLQKDKELECIVCTKKVVDISSKTDPKKKSSSSKQDDEMSKFKNAKQMAESLAEERAAEEQKARSYRDQLMITKLEVFDHEQLHNGMTKKSFY